MRSTGSFSVIEDNIVAPTPRKYPNVACSPRQPRRERREKSSDETFREAGFEIQNILFQKRPAAISSAHATTSHQTIATRPQPVNSHVSLLNLNDDELEALGNIMSLGSADRLAVASPLAHIRLVTPLRASNPITLNSPFHGEERPEQPSGRLYSGRIHTRGTTFSKKDLNRSRSLSWPGLPKNYKITEKA